MKSGECEYLVLPFDKYDEESLNALPDEVFFARRFKLSDEDQKVVDQHTYDIDGSKFRRVKVTDPIFKKYAALTNPKPGEPGSKERPLKRFGMEFVYDEKGRLLRFKRATSQIVEFTLTADMKPTKEQVEMVRKIKGKPITPDPDCPESTPEEIKRFAEYGRLRNERRKLKRDKALAN